MPILNVNNTWSYGVVLLFINIMSIIEWNDGHDISHASINY